MLPLAARARRFPRPPREAARARVRPSPASAASAKPRAREEARPHHARRRRREHRARRAAARRASRPARPRLADEAHSLGEKLGDAVTLWALRARRPPDEDHPYGHGRIESLGALGVSRGCSRRRRA